MYPYGHICAYKCMDIYVHVCIYAVCICDYYIQICIHLYTYNICIHMFIYVHINVCMYMYMCVGILYVYN